jgi:hypothetical protein
MTTPTQPVGAVARHTAYLLSAYGLSCRGPYADSGTQPLDFLDDRRGQSIRAPAQAAMRFGELMVDVHIIGFLKKKRTRLYFQRSTGSPRS